MPKEGGGSPTVLLNELDAKVRIPVCNLLLVHEDPLPMWGTMWTFGEGVDNYWLENLGGLQIMAECGFRIYEQEDFGYVFGIDGAGYDFYESHWIPLYKARGLKWHTDGGEAD